MKKYIELANTIEVQIKNGIFTYGDKLPSIRELRVNHQLSISTILKSMDVLISKGLINSKEKKGYYITYDKGLFSENPIVTRPSGKANYDEIEELIEAVFVDKETEEIDFSIGIPDKEILPINKIKKAVIEVMHQSPDAEAKYEPVLGNPELRKIISRRSMALGCNIPVDQIITTNGCMDALHYALQVSTNPGDRIITESPTFFGILQLANNLGLEVIEIETNSREGISLNEVERHLKQKDIKAVITVSNFGNPLGFCMSDESKKALVGLAKKYDTLIIEEDLYGDVFFNNKRPNTCKSFDDDGRVILCSSFSKTLVPGYRVGYIVTDKFHKQVLRLKTYQSIAASSISHKVVARILQTGRYDRYLNQLRIKLESNLHKYMKVIHSSFPKNTKMSKPEGGYMLWIELDPRIDSLQLFEECLKKNIRITPGRMFSLRDQYFNCIRISYGLSWSSRIENALREIGKIASKLLV